MVGWIERLLANRQGSLSAVLDKLLVNSLELLITQLEAKLGQTSPEASCTDRTARLACCSPLQTLGRCRPCHLNILLNAGEAALSSRSDCSRSAAPAHNSGISLK